MRPLRSDPAWQAGNYTEPYACKLGLIRIANVFALMGVCSAFYKQEHWKRLGFESLDALMVGFWEAWFAPMDPNASLVQVKKWKTGDSSKQHSGNLAKALGSIQAKTFVIAFEEDMFVPVQDCKYEQNLIPNSELKVVSSLMGHFAMLGLFEEDFQHIDNFFRELLQN